MTPASASSGRGRAFGPGPRRAAIAVAVTVVLALGAVALAAGHDRAGTGAKPGAGATSSTTTKTASTAKYGGLPSWLPKATVPVGRIVHASLSHSVLGIEGDTVAVTLAGGGVYATAVGPSVPESGSRRESSAG